MIVLYIHPLYEDDNTVSSISISGRPIRETQSLPQTCKLLYSSSVLSPREECNENGQQDDSQDPKCNKKRMTYTEVKNQEGWWCLGLKIWVLIISKSWRWNHWNKLPIFRLLTPSLWTRRILRKLQVSKSHDIPVFLSDPWVSEIPARKKERCLLLDKENIAVWAQYLFDEVNYSQTETRLSLPFFPLIHIGYLLFPNEGQHMKLL